MKRICVIGSMNIDLTVSTPRFHLPGETILGDSFATYTGGKGGNQAIALAKLGADVLMVGRLGEDSHGEMYQRALRAAGVRTDGILRDAGAPSGVALIEVDAAGENRIIVVPGTNARLDIAQIDALWPTLSPCDIFLLQLEIPIETTLHAAQRLHAANKTILLDPAPAPAAPLPAALLRAADYITPNETELSMLTGMPADAEADAIQAARKLLSLGARTVLCKRGRHGAILVTDQSALPIPGFPVNAIDTTAAGDSFNAGFAVALSHSLPPADAVRFANAVGALSTTAMGAQSAMPTLAQVEGLLGGRWGAAPDPA